MLELDYPSPTFSIESLLFQFEHLIGYLTEHNRNILNASIYRFYIFIIGQVPNNRQIRTIEIQIMTNIPISMNSPLIPLELSKILFIVSMVYKPFLIQPITE